MTDSPPRTAPRGSRQPVMADVARLAGVSHQTVSRVVNGLDNIRPDTRARVELAIKQLGYRRNVAARALVTRRSATIGVVGTESGLWGPTSIHRTIEDAARAAGLFVSSVNLQSVTREEFSAAVNHLLAHAVEGIIAIAAHDEALDVVRSQDIGVPLVVVEGDLTEARWTVGVDQIAGARLATAHLLALGHTEIMHVTGPMNWSEARARHEGWRREMYAAGLRPREPLSGDWTSESGHCAGLEILGMPEITAVFTANDQMAIGVLRALHEGGRPVPGAVSVVGFDDIPEAAYLIPPLTTVRQDFPAVGRRAIEVLTNAMTSAGDDRPELVEPELVVRASSTSPASWTARP